MLRLDGPSVPRTRLAMRAAMATFQLSVTLLTACGERPTRAVKDSPTANDGPVGSVVADSASTLTGAGATFPYPLYARWIASYTQRTGERVNYRSVGSKLSFMV